MTTDDLEPIEDNTTLGPIMEGTAEDTQDYKRATFSHVHNDDMTGCTFIYFDSGFVQSIGYEEDKLFKQEFCVHLNSTNVDKLKSALAQELNENTVFTPDEMVVIKNLVDNCLPDCKPTSMSNQQWKEFLTKLS